MKLYFAGVGRNVGRAKVLQSLGANNLMLTYAEKYSKVCWEVYSDFEILLDSGAFSCWKRKIKITLEKYCEFILEKKIKKYINLDVIGNHDETEQNLNDMIKNGLNPIPVFHYGTDINKLKKIVDNYDYICLGGTVGLKTHQRCEFFNKIFNNFPKTKFHGLGVTDPKLIKKYNFYSIDSSTWLIAYKSNQIIINGVREQPPQTMSSDEKAKINIEYFLNLCRINKYLPK